MEIRTENFIEENNGAYCLKLIHSFWNAEHLCCDTWDQYI